MGHLPRKWMELLELPFSESEKSDGSNWLATHWNLHLSPDGTKDDMYVSFDTVIRMNISTINSILV